MSDVPFGHGDKQTINCPSGDWLFVISEKTTGCVSKAGNPMIAMQFKVIDPEISDEYRYWPVRKWYVLRGEAVGIFKGLLSALDEEPELYLAEKLAIYDGDSDAANVAEFFDEAVVPELVGRTVRLRVKTEAATDDDGDPITGDDGEPRYNVEVERPLKS